MARPRKPTALHVLNGTLAHDPARFADRAHEPRCTDPLGEPLDTMQLDQRAAWIEIERLAPWLRAADRLAVELAAALLAQFRLTGVAAFPPPLLTRLETMLGRLGLTPSDRSKVTMPQAPRPENPFLRLRKRP